MKNQTIIDARQFDLARMRHHAQNAETRKEQVYWQQLIYSATERHILANAASS